MWGRIEGQHGSEGQRVITLPLNEFGLIGALIGCGVGILVALNAERVQPEPAIVFALIGHSAGRLWGRTGRIVGTLAGALVGLALHMVPVIKVHLAHWAWVVIVFMMIGFWAGRRIQEKP